MSKIYTQQDADNQFISGVRQMMKDAQAPKIIRHAGQLNEVEVPGPDGKIRRFRRQEEIYIPSMEISVKCAPTDNHFIFRDARHLGWTLFCTCGSPAVVVGWDAYKDLGSNSGAMLVCFCQTTDPNHRHNDGSL